LALILNIETATNVCSVALALDGKILSLRENKEGQSHARILTTLIAECLAESGNKISNLQAISVSKGPGSFTGLRIGVATAKGLCFALDLPLISVNSLQAMAFKLHSEIPTNENALFCPMIDARRMEVYSAIIGQDMEFVSPTSATIIQPGSFAEFIEKSPVFFFGDGIKKTIQLIGNHENAIYFETFEPSASGMVNFSEKSYNLGAFENVAFFEPFYLKDFYNPQQPL